ncbi:MAG: class I SAM-dependent methyltransferase [Candidatus Kapaibacteriota bacterium]
MSTEKTLQFFDSYAQKFDSLYNTKKNLFSSLINKFFRRSIYIRYQLAIEGCQPVEGRTVYDIGCGPGHYAISLARMGAQFVLGIDFAKNMIEIAKERAKFYGVEGRCKFVVADFFTYEPEEKFDYSILTGFMDYMPEPQKVIDKVVEFTRRKAFFSFPVDGGLLAWQRKFRYQWKCPLYLYNYEQVKNLFKEFPEENVQIQKISREYFVTLILDRT